MNYNDPLLSLHIRASKLEGTICTLREELEEVKREIERIEQMAENNVYDDIDEAEGEMEDYLYHLAYSEPHGRCGKDEYTCECLVGGKKYRATLYVEWNRFDKRFYFINDTDFTFEEITQ